MLDQTAIVLNTGARLNGRALAQSAVTLDASSVTIPAMVTMNSTLTPASTPTSYGSSSSGAAGSYNSSVIYPTVTTNSTTTNNISGCASTAGFSTTTGQPCAGNYFSVASTAKYDFGAVTLRNGSRGTAVMDLQRFLNAKLNLGLVVDGKLGPRTIAVIKKWQMEHGLVADGLIGAKTKARMNAE